MARSTAIRTTLANPGRVTELALKHLIIWASQALVLIGMAGSSEAITVKDYSDAFVVIVTVALIGALLMPTLYRLAVRLKPIFYPIITFLFYAWALLLLDQVLPGWRISNWWISGVTAGALTGVSTFLGSFLSISDDRAWQQFALDPMRARFARNDPVGGGPGFVFLEIDGLAEPVLRRAMASGYTPTLHHWVESGSHTLVPWECDLSSQTSAMQAGILLGSNADIPAFRWYDRGEGRVMVSNNARDAGLIERHRSNGNGLLANGGASRGNLVSGDAPDSLFTFSTLRNRRDQSTGQYFLFYTNLYNLARTMALFVADIFHEILAATWQVVRNERPRIRRFGVYPIVRAATTSVLRELSTFTVAGDMLRGVPAIYTTYVAYDEVAHHSGTERGDALRVLRQIDRDISRLVRVAAESPRPYHLVVLSDHGQTQGATFRQRYGESLAELVQRHLETGDGRGAQAVVDGGAVEDEGWAMVSVLLTDFLRRDRNEHPVLERALRSRALGEHAATEVEVAPGKDQVVVLASGNLGLVTVANASERQTMEAIAARHPGLIPALVEHPGVAFAVVETEDRGPLAVGRNGFMVLDDETVHGENPLARYSPHVPAMLRRSAGFANAPDIFVIGQWWPETGEVGAFEELVSSHGGLGGGQSTPFLLYPSTLAAPKLPIVGAEAVYRILKGWRDAAQSGGRHGG